MRNACAALATALLAGCAAPAECRWGEGPDGECLTRAEAEQRPSPGRSCEDLRVWVDYCDAPVVPQIGSVDACDTVADAYTEASFGQWVLCLTRSECLATVAQLQCSTILTPRVVLEPLCEELAGWFQTCGAPASSTAQAEVACTVLAQGLPREDFETFVGCVGDLDCSELGDVSSCGALLQIPEDACAALDEQLRECRSSRIPGCGALEATERGEQLYAACLLADFDCDRPAGPCLDLLEEGTR